MVKNRNGFVISVTLSVLLIMFVCPNPATSVDWDRWREHAENWINAIGTQSPDPVMATALSAVPSGTKVVLIQKCNKNMQDALLELLEPKLTEKRRQELNFLMDKNQAMKDALAGKPENFRRMLKELKNKTYTPHDHKKTARQKLEELERENMDDLITRLRKKAQDVYDGCKADIKESVKRKNGIYDKLNEIKDYVDDLEFRYFKALKWYDEQKKKNPCWTARDIEKKVRALCVVTIDNAKAYNRQIDLAKNRLANCSDSKDAAFIKSAFHQAKKSVAQIERDMTEIHGLAAQTNSLFDDYNALKNEYNSKIPDFAKKEDLKFTAMQNKVEDLKYSLMRFKETFASPYSAIRKIDAQAIDAMDYYVPRYPKSRGKWDALIRTITNIKFEIEGEYDTKAHDRKTDKISNKIMEIWKKIKQRKGVRLSDCKKASDTEKIISKADSARTDVLLDLARNIDIPDQADACIQRSVQAQPPGNTAPPANAPTQTPATQPTGTVQTPASPPITTDSGGLFISGKNRLRSGEGAAYTAQDGAGKPYISGVTWNSSVEDVFVMGADGSGVAFKAGATTIIAHKNDMVAYFDVTVEAVVPNLLGREVTEAIGILQGMGLNGGIPIKVSAGKKLQVTGQSVAPGTLADAGKMIVLEVEEAPADGLTDHNQDMASPGAGFSSAGGEVKPEPQPSTSNSAGGQETGEPAPSGFSTAGGEDKRTDLGATGGDSGTGAQAGEALNLLGTSKSDCVELQYDFNAAMNLGDTAWAQSVLDRSRRCGFSAAATSQLGQHLENKAREEERQMAEKCTAAENRFQARLNAGNVAGAEAIARGMTDCPGYQEAAALLNQHQAAQKCEQHRQQFLGHLNTNRIKMAQTILMKAQADGCQVSQDAVDALNRKHAELQREQQRQQQAAIERNQRQQQQMMNLLNHMMQNIQKQPTRPQRSPSIGTKIPDLPQSGSQTGSRPQTQQSEPTRTCRDVCVQERILWHSSDGRHSCCKGGRPDPKCIGIRCTKAVHCEKWEKRCN